MAKINISKLFATSARLIASASKKPAPIAEGMGKWFDYCESAAPELMRLWRRLRKVDFQMDASRLTRWIKRLFDKAPPPRTVNGLWFGLYNPYLGEEPSCQMYVVGSRQFDPSSELNEWASEVSYAPKNRYPVSEALHALYRDVEPLHENNISMLGEPFLCHGYLALLLSQWCHGPVRATLLGKAAIRAVVMGHDSGDRYRIAVLKPEGGSPVGRSRIS